MDSVTTEQRKTLAAVRKFCAEAEWATVLQGLELLVSLNDPVLWGAMASGLTLDRWGKIEIAADSEVARRAKAANRLRMALYCIAYGNNTGPITLLNLSYQDTLQDLTVLPRFGNIKSLNMDACDGISDLTPLAKLSNLEILSINYCNSISNLSSIANLVNLKELRIRNSPNIQDLKPLRNLVNLESLDMCQCERITDLEPLSNLKKLKTLDIGDTKATDLRPLSKLPQLEALQISGTYRAADIWVC
jgi:hypothetical protein